MKVGYTAPSCGERCYAQDVPVLALSGFSWDGSLQDTGSDWGGIDEDDSIFGL